MKLMVVYLKVYSSTVLDSTSYLDSKTESLIMLYH